MCETHINASNASNFKLARRWVLIDFYLEKLLLQTVVLDMMTRTHFQCYCKRS